MLWKVILLVSLLAGCSPVKTIPKPAPLPVCSSGQLKNCRLLPAGEMGLTVRGHSEETNQTTP